MSYGIHTFGLTKEQIYLIGVYFLYQVADILSFQTAYGKGFLFLVHRIEYHVAFSLLEFVYMVQENSYFTRNLSFDSHNVRWSF